MLGGRFCDEKTIGSDKQKKVWMNETKFGQGKLGRFKKLGRKTSWNEKVRKKNHQGLERQKIGHVKMVRTTKKFGVHVSAIKFLPVRRFAAPRRDHK